MFRSFCALAALSLTLAALTPRGAAAQDVDLLHAVPSTVIVSSAYRDRATQAARLVDGDTTTAWNSSSGDLVGAWIEVELPADARVSAIRMTAGFTHQTGDRDLFMGNHRVTDVAIVHGDEVTLAQLDDDDMSLQNIDVSGGGGTYRIVITGLFEGDRRDWRETCISELQVLGQAPGARAGQLTPTTRVAPSAAPGEGGVFFTVDNIGVGALREGGRGADVFRDSYSFFGVVATTGAVYVLDEQGLFEAREGRRRATPRLPRRDEARALARDGEGRLLVLGARDVYRLDGRRWRPLGLTLEREDDRGFREIAVDGQGTIWLLHPMRGPHRVRDGALEPMAIAGARAPYRMLTAGPDGTVALANRTAVFRWGGSSWRTVERPTGGGGISGLAVRPNGDVWVGAYRNPVSFGASGAPVPVRLAGATLGNMTTATYDPQGNMWVAATGGLYVIAPNLHVLRHYRNIPVLEGGVSAISVTGAGPFY